MKSIILNTDETQRLIRDKQIVIRRPLKPQPELKGGWWVLGGAMWNDGTNPVLMSCHSLYNRIPHAVGDELYVQEVWDMVSLMVHGDHYIYTIKYFDGKTKEIKTKRLYKFGGHSPCTMPREAARLFPVVKAEKVERLQDISTDEIISIGIKGYKEGCSPFVAAGIAHIKHKEYWNARFPKYPYDTNPWTVAETIELTEVEG